MPWRITEPRADEAAEMAEVHVAVWREAYADLVPAEFLAGLDPVQAAESWRARLLEPDADIVQLVARDDAGIAGLATGGPARDEEAPAGWQLYAINVLARAHGTGLARELLEHAVGDRAAYLWVLEGNDRAIAFYRKHGFELDGAREIFDRTGTPELRMTRGERAG